MFREAGQVNVGLQLQRPQEVSFCFIPVIRALITDAACIKERPVGFAKRLGARNRRTELVKQQ